MTDGQMPNFLLIGTEKAGTTSLFQYLRQHPDLFMPEIKEPGFFASGDNGVPLVGQDRAFIEWQELFYVNRPWVRTLAAYQDLFGRVGTERAVGEVTPMYLASERAARCIRHYVPDARLIVILRDPVERAYSAYLMGRRLGHEDCASFGEVERTTELLDATEAFVPQKHPRYMRYFQAGHYHHFITRYLDHVDDDRLRIYLFEDFSADPLGTVQDMFSFLDVDPCFVPDVGMRHNRDRPERAGNALIRLFEKVVPSEVRRAARSWAPMSVRYHYDRVRMPEPLVQCPEASRARLVDYYRDGILRLETLLHRDLGAWLTVE